MKLLLMSSYELGGHSLALRRLAGEGDRAGLVFNALDQYVDTRLRQRPIEEPALEAIGLNCDEVDLRDYFGDPSGLRQRLDDLDVLWVLGGNTFVLARAMHLSGFREAVEPALTAERLVYAGYSAGACVTGPDLRGIDFMDDPSIHPSGYPAGTPAVALGWLPFRLVPHWRDGDEPAAAVVEHCLERGLVFRTLRDGDAIVIGSAPGERG